MKDRNKLILATGLLSIVIGCLFIGSPVRPDHIWRSNLGLLWIGIGVLWLVAFYKSA